MEMFKSCIIHVLRAAVACSEEGGWGTRNKEVEVVLHEFWFPYRCGP